MTNDSDNPLTSPSDDELLTAYLDGELEEEARVEVEKRLAVEADFRANLHRLQRTWDMLDELPQAKLENSFTKSTIELVVADAQRESSRQRARIWDWPLRVLALIGLPLATFYVCWSAIHYWQDTDNRELVNKAPVIDNVDVYLKTESVDFLMQLEEMGLFGENDEYEVIQ